MIIIAPAKIVLFSYICNFLNNNLVISKKSSNFAAEVAKLMSKTLKDRLDYLIALVSEFAATHHLSLQQAYLYLQQYKGLDFADEFYDIEHTLSFDQAVEDITMYCKRMGGSIA